MVVQEGSRKAWREEIGSGPHVARIASLLWSSTVLSISRSLLVNSVELVAGSWVGAVTQERLLMLRWMILA